MSGQINSITPNPYFGQKQKQISKEEQATRAARARRDREEREQQQAEADTVEISGHSEETEAVLRGADAILAEIDSVL